MTQKVIESVASESSRDNGRGKCRVRAEASSHAHDTCVLVNASG